MLALVGPAVEKVEGGLFQRDGTLVIEFAERDPQPASGRAVVDDAVELEIEQLTDAHPGATHDGQPGSREGVIELGDGSHERCVDLRWQRPWEQLKLAGDVGGEHQPGGVVTGPSPRRRRHRGTPAA